jgi:hypothetical protein
MLEDQSLYFCDVQRKFGSAEPSLGNHITSLYFLQIVLFSPLMYRLL